MPWPPEARVPWVTGAGGDVGPLRARRAGLGGRRSRLGAGGAAGFLVAGSVVAAGGDRRGLRVAVAVAVPVLAVAAAVAVHRDALGQHLVQALAHPAHAAAHGTGRYRRLLQRGHGRARGQAGRWLPGLEHGSRLLVDRPGLLDVLAGGQLPDDPGLDAVLQQVQVPALQAQADPLRGPVRDDRAYEYRPPGDLRGHVQRDVQLVGYDVVGALQPEHA